MVLCAEGRPFAWRREKVGRQVIKPAHAALKKAVAAISLIVFENFWPAPGELERQAFPHNADGIGGIDKDIGVVIKDIFFYHALNLMGGAEEDKGGRFMLDILIVFFVFGL